MPKQAIFANFETIFANFDSLDRQFLIHFTHPCRHGLPHALLKGEGEGAVTAVATPVRQLLGGDVALVSGSLAIELDKMADAQVVDIGIVGSALTGEILTEIETVGSNLFCQLYNTQVVL